MTPFLLDILRDIRSHPESDLAPRAKRWAVQCRRHGVSTMALEALLARFASPAAGEGDASDAGFVRPESLTHASSGDDESALRGTVAALQTKLAVSERSLQAVRRWRNGFAVAFAVAILLLLCTTGLMASRG